MKIAAAQLQAIDGQIDANIEMHLRFIAAAAQQNARLILFPELSLTGYQRERAQELAFIPGDARLQPIQQAADENEICIIAGAPIEINKQLYIGAFIFQPGKASLIYTKQTLHTDEEQFFVPGFEHNPLLEIENQRVSIAICADITDAVHAYHAGIKHTTLYLASIFYTPGGIAEAYTQLSEYANAYHMHVLMSNYVGSSYTFDAAGRSACWSNNGAVIAQLGAHEEGLLIAEV